MDNIMDNQWNLGLNLTLEEYETDNSTSDDFPSNFDWEFFHERSNFKLMGLQIGMLFGVFWPGILLILLRLVGYAVIGLTFGYGREFVNATFFQWSDEVVKNFEWLFSQGDNLSFCLCQLFYLPSLAIGCIVGRQVGSMYVELHANFLEKSNMTWAEIQVEKQAINDNEFISQIIAIVLLGFFMILSAAIVCSIVCPKRRNGFFVLSQESEIPFFNEDSQTPNSNQESQTPNSNQESQTPNSNQESQTNEESIPIRTPEEYHTIWVDNVNF